MKVSFDILCLDEHDSPNLSEFKHKTRLDIKNITNRRHFVLCGVVIPGAEYPDIKLKGRHIQEKIFGEGNFTPFHYVEILNNSGKFAFLGANIPKRTSLIMLLNNYLKKSKFKIITSFIDKQKLALKYGIFQNKELIGISKIKPGISGKCALKDINLYLISLKTILRRYYLYLKPKRKRGLIIAESRGDKEDMNLLDAFYYYQRNGVSSISAKELRYYIIDLLIVHKKQNHLGLQIADLVTYPCYDYKVSDHNVRMDHFISEELIKDKLSSIDIFPL